MKATRKQSAKHASHDLAVYCGNHPGIEQIDLREFFARDGISMIMVSDEAAAALDSRPDPFADFVPDPGIAMMDLRGVMA